MLKYRLKERMAVAVKSWFKLLLIVLVWVGIAVLISARVYFVQGGRGGESFVELLMAQLPGWLLWAAATPLIFWTAKKFPFSNPATALGVQVIFSLFFIALYSVTFVAVDTALSGKAIELDSLADSAITNLRAHWLFILAIYWIVAAVAYGFRLSFARKPPGPERFENSILIKTNYGFVLVEIEKFQYVKGGGKRIMFHTTGRSRHLDRNREALARGKIVEESRYRPDRRIVIDLGKIRRAEQTGPDRYLFHIGYSHEIYLNQDYYRKLGGWLPTPVITYKKD